MQKMECSFKYANDLWNRNGSVNINYAIIIHCFQNGKLVVYILYLTDRDTEM